ncbi:hypothetical protein N7453_010369 [Penicillium expansum]|nr:hypothetical protein N7453_010369 [Penicillium expansum]
MVVTSSDRESGPYQIRTYCEWINTSECIAADGWAADPFILIQGDHYFDEWLTYERTPDGTGFMLNPGGRVSEKAACECIGSFHRQTKDRTADGHPRQVNRFKSTRPPWRQMLNMMDG